MFLRRLFFGLAMAGIAAGPNVGSTAELPVVGWVERVLVYPGKFEIHAKIDSGAKTSSLNAPDMKIFQRDGAEWVQFMVTNRRGVSQNFEEKVVRISKIRRHGGQIQRRPVVMMGICVGRVYRVTQVNLIDRRNFNYQMLIGRRFMAGNVVVDPGKTFITKPDCNRGAEK